MHWFKIPLSCKKRIKINTAYCNKFLGNTPRNLIWNNIDYILYNVVRRAIATRFDLAQGSHQATCTKKYYSIQQKSTLSSSLECTPRPHSKILFETRSNSSSYNIAENIINIIPYQIVWCVS